MKTIHNINKWSFIVTMLLYLTILGGLLAQIALGVIQVILGFIILFYWKQLHFTSKKHIFFYWLFFICYWILFTVLDTDFNDITGLLFYILIPMGIAGYFVFVTNKLRKSDIEIETLPSYYT